MGRARAIQSLASTAESAHRAGVALSVDQFESILLDYVVDAFDPIPHTPS